MAKKKQKALMPSTIYVCEVEDGDDKYLVASYAVKDTIAEGDEEPRLIGIYQLVECGEVVSTVAYKKL
jgi:hypothetical protein